jgi:hypothetical protein
MPKVELNVEPGRIVSNDHSHPAHTPDNPDDGSLSPFAVALGEALKKLGMEVEVKSRD